MKEGTDEKLLYYTVFSKDFEMENFNLHNLGYLKNLPFIGILIENT